MKTLKLSTLFILFSMISACNKEDKNKNSSDRDEFVGFYTLTENCDGDIYSYSITIGVDPNSSDGVTISNLGEEGETVNATVNANSVSIPSQIVNDISAGDQYTVQGNGTLNGNTLTLNYTIEYDGCVATCIKQ